MIKKGWKKLTTGFRNLSGAKARIFKLVDQVSDEDKVRLGTSLAIISGKDMKKESMKKEYLKKYQFHQLQLCKEVSKLEPYLLPKMEQMMDNDQTLLAFLMQHQNQTMTTSHPALFDLKTPLEFEMILLRDSQM